MSFEVVDVWHREKLLAKHIRMNPVYLRESSTEFLTHPRESLQVGIITIPEGGNIPAHTHTKIQRVIDTTAEVIIVHDGSLIAKIFSTDDENPILVKTIYLRATDVLVLFAGGHSFYSEYGCRILEVKQGPYTGTIDKVRLNNVMEN